jgi:hypothetical protein
VKSKEMTEAEGKRRKMLFAEERIRFIFFLSPMKYASYENVLFGREENSTFDTLLLCESANSFEAFFHHHTRVLCV